MATKIGTDNSETLTSELGLDVLIGLAGDDIYSVNDTGDIVVEEAGAGEGNDTVNSSASYTLSENVENLVLSGTAALYGIGNDGANTITGNSGANLLSGGEGDDTLDGGVGNDILDGGNGDDDLTGGAGNDTLDGGNGDDDLTGGAGDDLYRIDSADDEIVEVAGEGTDTVESSITYTLAGQGLNT